MTNANTNGSALPTRTDVDGVEKQIRPHIRTTPVVTIPGSTLGVAAISVTFKLELTQYSGSFKCRGAFANLVARDIPAAGVVAASGGNHGAAVAYAAGKLDVPARVYVPSISSPAKLERIKSYGAELVVGGDGYSDALAASESWLQTSGALPVHAFDQRETILGQATLAKELNAQAQGIDTVLVSVGGGGLIAGIATWYQDSCRVVGVEPKASPTLRRALDAGLPVDAPTGGYAADSLSPRRIGENVYPIAERYVDDVVLVDDDVIIAAQQRLWQELRIVAEPGGATAFAGLMSSAYVARPGERIGVVVSGGNTTAVDFDR